MPSDPLVSEISQSAKMQNKRRSMSTLPDLEALEIETDEPLDRLIFQLAPDQPNTRLDRFLSVQPEVVAANLSRTRLKGLIEAGQVEVDGALVQSASLTARGGQVITLKIPVAVEPLPGPEKIPLKIVFEDDHLIVIDKAAGLVVHPAAGHGTGTLVNALIHHCGESLSGIGGVKRPGIVHRLDKDTTGLLVVAKSDAAHRGLAKVFADHGRNLPLVREYLAFVWGAPDRGSGTIETYLGRHPTNREKIAVVSEEKGRLAITHWRRLKEFAWRDGTPVASLIACQLETGRTHQIRVHMSHIGHPLLGDPVYAKGFQSKTVHLSIKAKAALEKLKRQALHAAVLGFPHPVTHEELCFESPLPKDLAKLQAALEP
jgi:23S rRNA pseudouridine1911/1915/1917 synthase